MTRATSASGQRLPDSRGLWTPCNGIHPRLGRRLSAGRNANGQQVAAPWTAVALCPTGQPRRWLQSMADMSNAHAPEAAGANVGLAFSLWGVVKEVEETARAQDRALFRRRFADANGLVEQFKSMISDASRPMSACTIDAEGLTTASDQGRPTNGCRGGSAMDTYVRTAEHETAAGNMQEFRPTFDRTIDNLPGPNAQNVMMELAEDDRWFLIANTNDFPPPIAEAPVKFSTYYRVSSAKNELLDGRFRAIGEGEAQ